MKDEDNIRFTVKGRPATVFDLRKGIMVSADKIIEELKVEVSIDTTIVGRALVVAKQAAAPETAKMPKTVTTPETPAPASSQPSVPESTSPAAAQPAAPETGGTATSPLLWLGLIAVIVMRKSRGKAGE